MIKFYNFLKRSFKEGFSIFLNETSLTIVNIMTTIMVSLILWLTVFSFYFLNQLNNFLQERLDFSIYFKSNVSRQEIEKIQKIISNFPGVNEVQLITQEMALEKLKKDAKANPVIERALLELKTNPLVDYLIVRAKSSEIYPKISEYLQKSPYSDKIEYLTYFENQKIIQKAIKFSNILKIINLGLIIIVLTFSVLIIFNTIYISVHSLKDEIEILQLLGASNTFIRGPFFFYTLFFSIFSYIISLGVLIFFLEKTKNFWPLVLSNFLPHYFILENFLQINAIIFFIIITINLLSTLLSLQKHLK